MIVLHVFDLAKVSRILETKEFRHKKRESRYTIKGALLLKYVKINQRFSTYLIAFVELYIKTHKCNSLMNNRRIVIVNVVKIIQKLQA